MSNRSISITLHKDAYLGINLDGCMNSQGFIRVNSIEKSIQNRNSPHSAFLNEISPGDFLVSVDDTPLRYLEYNEVIRLIRLKRPIKLTFTKCSYFKTLVNKGVTAVENFYESYVDEEENKPKKLVLSPSFEEARKAKIPDKVNIEDFASAVDNKQYSQMKLLCFRFGVPEEIRPVCWKILLPEGLEDLNDISSTSFISKLQTSLYMEYLKTFLHGFDPTEVSSTSRRPEFLSGQGWWENSSNVIQSNSSSLSNSGENHADKILREKIWKDVQRTYPGFQYFSVETYEKLERILFIYAKLNPAIGYSQGMNEMVAPIAYVLDVQKSFEHESSCFFAFCGLMSRMRLVYLSQEKLKEIHGDKNSSVYVERLMKTFSKLLLLHDKTLFIRLVKELEVEPYMYCYRWLTTLFTREFDLPDTLRLWDSILSASENLNFKQISKDNGRNDEFWKDGSIFCFPIYLSVGMLLSHKKKLMDESQDFSQVVSLLQTIPPVDVKNLLDLSSRMYQSDLARGITLEKLESTSFEKLYGSEKTASSLLTRVISQNEADIEKLSKTVEAGKSFALKKFNSWFNQT
eukprot:maker-scaffold_1-snap-gene-5.41-mRNA-1 protein AED:0.00 eAED:0.00 QI:32/1/1/1/1/1/3/52/572